MSSTDQLTTEGIGVKSSGDQKSSLHLQHTDNAENYAEMALRQLGYSSRLGLLRYESVIRLVEYLRHGNPDCAKTIVTYLSFLNTTLTVLKNITPNDLVRVAKEVDQDQLEALFLDIDDHWLGELNSTATRLSKWAALKTFLIANGVRKASLLKCNIRSRRKVVDYALTKEDCRLILDHAKTIEDKLTISLLIESLQRIGTISLLTWEDVKPHLEKGEEIFLIWIDPLRTKRNIEHWMPVGPLSTYYMRKRLVELKEPTPETKLLGASLGALMENLHRIMVRAGVLGKRQVLGKTQRHGKMVELVRYEKHIHSFRKFGVVEMQRQGVNEQVIRFLMGQKRDTYSEWKNRYDDLLEIYREARPRLDQKATLDDILEYAKARGYSLDPKHLQKIGEIRVGSIPHQDSGRRAEATRAFSSSQN